MIEELHARIMALERTVEFLHKDRNGLAQATLRQMASAWAVKTIAKDLALHAGVTSACFESCFSEREMQLLARLNLHLEETDPGAAARLDDRGPEEFADASGPLSPLFPAD